MPDDPRRQVVADLAIRILVHMDAARIAEHVSLPIILSAMLSPTEAMSTREFGLEVVAGRRPHLRKGRLLPLTEQQHTAATVPGSMELATEALKTNSTGTSETGK